MNSNPSRRSPRDKTATAELRRNVVALRRQRLTFEEIGERCGFSGPRAYRVYADALKAIPAPTVEHHRAEELDLIENQIRMLIEAAQKQADDLAGLARISSAICRWAERKAKLLGLDSPQVNVNYDAGTVRYEIVGVDMDKL